MVGHRRVTLSLCLLLVWSSQALADTFTHKTTGEVLKGKHGGNATKNGVEYLMIKTEDGRTRFLPLDEWEMKKDSPSIVHKQRQGEGGATVQVNLGGEKPASVGRVMDVVVTGTGPSPEQARQNAFSNAIEQAVGVLVDAETLVQNDQVVREQILTFSRGYVQSFTVTGEWQNDGVNYVRMRAKVSIDELSAKLQAQKISVREVPGELMYRQVKHELVTQENAAEMLRKALDDYGIRTLAKAEIVGKPEVIQKDQTHAKLRIKVALKSDLNAWPKYRNSVLQILEKVATHRASLSTPRWLDRRLQADDGAQVIRRLGGASAEGSRIALFRAINPPGTITHWDVFLVPNALGEVVNDVYDRRQFSVRVVLLDAGGKMVAEQSITNLPYFQGLVVHNTLTGYGGFCGWWLGPLLVFGAAAEVSGYATSVQAETTLDLSLDQLRDVAKATAFIEGYPPAK